jgi:3-dehydroquinate dehydratase/shikimate dehydrogenase
MDPSHQPRICISICAPTVAALESAISAAVQTSNLIEVRLDCLDPVTLENGASVITKLLQEAHCKSILTFRPEEQGGRRQLDNDARKEFWSAAIFPESLFPESLFDVELDLAEKFNSDNGPPTLPIDWRRMICSHHDFAGVPVKIDQIFERLADTPARVLKIAVWANDATDCLPVFHLLESARIKGREMIAIAMGPAGLATRILGPSRGAFLTYASPEQGTATAPGQPTAIELKEIYRIEKIDRHTQIFGLVGQPASHSISPRLHNAAFEGAGWNALYLPFEVADAKAFMRRMIHPRTRELNWNMQGLSVTAPHKSAFMDQLDSIEPAAREIGAVNTIVVDGDVLRGYNTEARGFLRPLKTKFGDLTRARIAILGAGGIASAALWSLNQAGARATLFARDSARVRNLAERFQVEWQPLADDSYADFDVVVNATPLGTAGLSEDQTPTSALQLRGARLAFDLVYNPMETLFLRQARLAGCETLGGLEMLVAQATDQFRLWTGVTAPEDIMYDAARKVLAQKPSE